MITLGSDWRRMIPTTPGWDGVALCPPDHFQVVDVKNVFMTHEQGAVDPGRARAQWDDLVATYRRLGVAVHVLPALPGCEDMVFCANGVALLPRPGGGADAVLSTMRHPSRAREVPAVADWLGRRGLRPVALPAALGHLEGHGDLLVVPGRRLALGGHGGRSDARALLEVERLTGMPVVPLALQGDVFYHLDTCLMILDEDTVLCHPPAFLPGQLRILRTLFPRVLVADEAEAREGLAVNVHALADGHVLMPASAPRTGEVLAAAGYTPVPVDLSEFHRSGGSVFCLRLDLPAAG